jgi:hypothetical protein
MARPHQYEMLVMLDGFPLLEPVSNTTVQWFKVPLSSQIDAIEVISRRQFESAVNLRRRRGVVNIVSKRPVR